jgi:hypothetical protein
MFHEFTPWRDCDRARLGQDLTYGEACFVLTEAVRIHIWRTLARFSSE